MADFDNFESAAQNPTEEDPAAAFLAREQDQLAELEDDNFGVSGESEPQQVEQEQDVLATEASDGDMFGRQATPPEMGEPMTSCVDTDDLLAEFDSVPASTTETHSSDAYSAISQVDQQRAEPEQIRIWREEQKVMLEKKDEEAEVKKEEWKVAAAQELKDWEKHQDEQLEKTKKNNEEAEAAFIQERDENVPGHEWERVCRLCEFNPKGSRNVKDVSRMRSILLQLKQTPLQRA